VSPLTLEEFEREALAPLLLFGEIDSLSPDFDDEWDRRGRIEDAAQLVAEFARGRRLASCDVAIKRLAGRTPVVTATVGATAPSAGTVVLYGHLDKQPPLGEWSAGLAPFSPTRVGDRLYARGIADDGYSAFAALLALEDLERRGVGHARCVVLIEASEESGSPDLEAHLSSLEHHLGEVQLLICLDSGALTYDRLWVTTSLRGNLIARVRVDVLEQGRHSGTASGVVPSSFRVMRQLLDRLEDPATGQIRLAELHRPVPDAHRDAATAVTDEFGDVAGDEQPVVAGLRLMGEGAADRLLRRTWSATLSVTGVDGIPNSSVAGNVLRPYTELVVSLRVPPGVDGASARDAVERALTTDPPHGAAVAVEFRAFAEGWEMPPSAPWLSAALDGASRAHFGNPVGFAGEGGSIPFLAVLGQRYPGVQIVATGVLGPGSNAHSIDEMLDLPTAVAVTNAVADLVAAHAAHAG
jgi:acetylornithine deacetylase/succinyl-diaminopimelate desuccinylase-like protein